MLVLSRLTDQKIVIGTDPPIVITICSVDRGKVRVGISGTDLPVDRLEIWNEKYPDRRIESHAD